MDTSSKATLAIQALLTAAQARDLFEYRDGQLISKVRRATYKPGDVCGTPGALGYLRTRVNGTRYKVHRLVWLIVKGEWPSAHIDHINGDAGDNRIENLRDVTHTDNQRNQRIHDNNTSGIAGVTRERGLWRARIRFNGQRVCLGLHKTLEAAADARSRAMALYGFHDNHGLSVTLRRDSNKGGKAANCQGVA